MEKEKWIPVKRPPKGSDENRSVLVYTPHNRCQYMAYYDGNKWRHWEGYDEFTMKISHWRMLPACPVIRKKT